MQQSPNSKTSTRRNTRETAENLCELELGKEFLGHQKHNCKRKMDKLEFFNESTQGAQSRTGRSVSGRLCKGRMVLLQPNGPKAEGEEASARGLQGAGHREGPCLSGRKKHIVGVFGGDGC